ncbi:MAG TPA: TIGR00366 family protein [Pseudomonadota bacterium]|nr:TIGR00366 family protein [Pseudomonadota bacterium]
MRTSLLERLALRVVAALERHLPDALIFALLATGLVLLAALGLAPSGQSRLELCGKLIDGWGSGFFSLLPFTLQMVMIIICGHTVASAPPVKRLLYRLAAVPATARGAVAWVTLMALVTSWFNWGFSLIFSALLARAVAQNLQRRGTAVDYRALAAASFLGLGSIWAQGLSGSAALQMATPGTLSESLRRIVDWGGEAGSAAVPAWNRWGSGVIPLSQTIFLWQSLLAVGVELVLVTVLMWRAAPRGEQAVTAAALGISLEDESPSGEPGEPDRTALRPGERWEHSPILTALFVAMGAAYLWRYVRAARSPLEAIHLNTINLTLLLLGAALHRTPARLMRAFAAGTQAVWGVLLQFPFYGAIAGMLSASALNQKIAAVFVSASTKATLPPLIALYSALLGVLVPSGGGKWLIEAPYVLTAAHQMKVHLGWMVAVYDLGEALANLVQPFWMLPVLALLGLRARDVMGYTFLVFLFLLPTVLVLTLVLGLTLSYPL